MINENLIKWLLDGDVAIQYQVHRDLLGTEQDHLRQKIASTGWGAAFLSRGRGNISDWNR
jgi:hypothetical protein